MSSGWQGYMGVAIALSGERYYYWFYSDVILENEPDYPISGTYVWTDGILTLKQEYDQLYSSVWVAATNAGRACLWAERDVGDFPRMLIPDTNFDPSNPFMNQGVLNAEQAVDGHPPQGVGSPDP